MRWKAFYLEKISYKWKKYVSKDFCLIKNNSKFRYNSKNQIDSSCILNSSTPSFHQYFKSWMGNHFTRCITYFTTSLKKVCATPFFGHIIVIPLIPSRKQVTTSFNQHKKKHELINHYNWQNMKTGFSLLNPLSISAINSLEREIFHQQNI